MTFQPAEIAQGPIFIGVIINVVLLGIMVTQSYMYFKTFKQDKMWMKILVFLLLIMDTTNTVFDLVYLYNTLIINFGDVSNLAQANWVFDTDPAMTAIIASTVQMFFAWRIKILTKSVWLTSLVVACAVAGGLGGLATAIACGIVREFIQFRRFQAVVILWLGAECVGDFIITSALVWHLKSQKTGFQHMDDIVDRLIRLIIQTGMLTMICAITDLLLFLTIPTGAHLIFNMPLSKLYTNSLMSSLNARKGAIPTTHVSRVSADVKPTRRNRVNLRGPEVFVHVESHEMVDREVGPKDFKFDF